MKIDKIKIYILDFILLAILSFALFVPNIFNKTIIAILFTICAIIANYTIKKRKVESVHTKKVTMLLIFFAIIYLLAFYLMGIYFGYYESVFKLGTNTIIAPIIPMTFIIISGEKIRNILLAQNIKGNKILTFIIMVLLDIIIYYDVYDMDSYEKMLEIIGIYQFKISYMGYPSIWIRDIFSK